MLSPLAIGLRFEVLWHAGGTESSDKRFLSSEFRNLRTAPWISARGLRRFYCTYCVVGDDGHTSFLLTHGCPRTNRLFLDCCRRVLAIISERTRVRTLSLSLSFGGEVEMRALCWVMATDLVHFLLLLLLVSLTLTAAAAFLTPTFYWALGLLEGAPQYAEFTRCCCRD